MNPDSDRGTAYHEMAHASHFTNVGSDWWQHLTEFELYHGHGSAADQNLPDAGYVAIAESWADHLGVLFDAGNIDFSPDNEMLIQETNGWIPEGLHYDLYDSNVDLPAGPPFFGTGITDNVSGFINAMIFDVLDNTVNKIPGMIPKYY